ncbi:hypothetical protein X566_13480 [Afipia sp. P52-10]|nr:hypothetical protein X566_13480 [Afipia sp. P52-10]
MHASTIVLVVMAFLVKAAAADGKLALARIGMAGSLPSVQRLGLLGCVRSLLARIAGLSLEQVELPSMCLGTLHDRFRC